MSIYFIVCGVVIVRLFLSFMMALHSFLREEHMPIAVATDVAERKELKTLPANPEIEGPDGAAGYVMIRRLSGGEKMARRAINSKMSVKAGGKGKNADATTEINAFDERVDLFDFAHCITAHNLTDEKGRPLNFRDPADVKMLAGHVMEEIQTYMDELNNFELDDEAKNS
jgi:hypothetical protein